MLRRLIEWFRQALLSPEPPRHMVIPPDGEDVDDDATPVTEESVLPLRK